MKVIIVMFFICMLAVVGCKKGGSSPSDTKPAYLGKWTLVYIVDWHDAPDGYHKDTLPAHVGEYIEFKTDGTLTNCEYTNQGTLNSFDLNYQITNGIISCHSLFPDSSKVIVSGNTLIIDASDPTVLHGREDLWWHFKR